MENGTTGRWLDVNAAAEELGVSTDAVRKRVTRGSLRSERTDAGVRVWLDFGGTTAGREASEAVEGALVETLRDEISHLRRESERKDAIIMSLSQSDAELSRTIRAIEPAQDAPRDVTETSTTTTTPVDRETPAQRAPWWRRILGA